MTLLWYIDIEPEVGIAQRFGQEDETELWVAIYFRWTLFPWNSLIRTTFALSTGLNYATGFINDISPGARRKALLHYLSPELTLALPKYEQYELLVRWHHRSGAGTTFPGLSRALFNEVGGESTYFTVGLRNRF